MKFWGIDSGTYHANCCTFGNLCHGSHLCPRCAAASALTTFAFPSLILARCHHIKSLDSWSLAPTSHSPPHVIPAIFPHESKLPPNLLISRATACFLIFTSQVESIISSGAKLWYHFVGLKKEGQKSLRKCCPRSKPVLTKQELSVHQRGHQCPTLKVVHTAHRPRMIETKIPLFPFHVWTFGMQNKENKQ